MFSWKNKKYIYLDTICWYFSHLLHACVFCCFFCNEKHFIKQHVLHDLTDKPGAPQGPLEAEDIRGEELTLVWKAPKDNGGERISNYVVEKKKKGSDKWTKVSGAVSLPQCNVRNLEPGEEYEFRVMAANAHGVGEPLMTSAPILAKLPYGKYHHYYLHYVNKPI